MAGRAGPRYGSPSRKVDPDARTRSARGNASSAEPATSSVEGLQSTLGNRALGRLLAPDQPPSARIARLAADATVDALVKGADDDPTFNPLTIVGDLQRAINETDPDYDSIRKGTPTRPVDFAVVARALADRTAAQIATIDAVWKSRHGGRSVRVDLFGVGGSGYESSLNKHQRSRLEVLMRGTKGGAVTGDSASLTSLPPLVRAAAAPMLSGIAAGSDVAATLNRLESDAIELRELIAKGLDDKGRLERVMALHRRDPVQIRVMDAFYTQRFSLSLAVHLDVSLTGRQRQRLAWLREGKTDVADTFAIEAARASAEKLIEDVPEGGVFDAVRKEIRNKAMAEVQAIVETNTAEAMDEARSTGTSADASVRARLGAILNKPAASGFGSLGGALRGTFGAAGAAVAELGESNLITAHARELVAMEEAGTTSTERLAAILSAIREQARVDVHAIASSRTTPADVLAQINANSEGATAELAKQYIGQFRSEYERMPGGRPFTAILKSASDANEARLEDLMAGGGAHTSDLAELELAISRKDEQAVKAVLRRQPHGSAMKKLEADYDRAHVVRLRVVLFGTHLGEDAKARDLRGETDNMTGAQYAEGIERQAMGGLLSGRDAASAGESLSKPDVMNGAEEVDWIASQGRSEVAVTLAHRGVTGDMREWGDDPETQIILETTKGDLGRLAALWHSTKPEEKERRDTILRVMRKVRSTVSSDATAYEEDNARTLDAIRSAVTFAIQIGLAIAIPGAGPGLMAFINTAAVNIAASVATNFVVRMGDYGWDSLKADVIGGLLGAGGGKFGEEFLGVVAKTITGDVARVAAQAGNRAGMASKLLGEAEQAGFSAAEMASYRELAAEAAETAGLAEAAASTGLAKAGGVFEKGMGMAGNYVASTAATSAYSGQSGFTGEEFGKALVLALAGQLAPSPKAGAAGGEEGAAPSTPNSASGEGPVLGGAADFVGSGTAPLGEVTGAPTTATSVVGSPVPSGGGGPETSGQGGGGGRDTHQMTAAEIGAAATMEMPAFAGETGTADTARMNIPDSGTGPGPVVDTPATRGPTELMDPAFAATGVMDVAHAPTGVMDSAAAPSTMPTAAKSAQNEGSKPPGAPSGPTARPAAGTAYADPVAASRALADASLAGGPMRLINEPGEALRSWQETRPGDWAAPAAWVDATGKLVVDTTRVRAVVRSTDILSGPIGKQAIPAGLTMESIPPRPAGPTMESIPPSRNAPATDGGDAPRANAASVKPLVLESIHDTTLAAHAYHDRYSLYRGSMLETAPGATFDAATYQANWALAGGEGLAPPAWLDQLGRMNVDATRVDVHSPPMEGAASPTGPAGADGGVDGGPTSAMSAPDVASGEPPTTIEVGVPIDPSAPAVRIEMPSELASVPSDERTTAELGAQGDERTTAELSTVPSNERTTAELGAQRPGHEADKALDEQNREAMYDDLSQPRTTPTDPSAALQFGPLDLVYGPSARDKLRELTDRSGGRRLNEMAESAVYSSMEPKSAQALDWARAGGGKVHFDLTHMADIPGALAGTGEHGGKVTAFELRYIREGWNEGFSAVVVFYRDGAVVAPPWLSVREGQVP